MRFAYFCACMTVAMDYISIAIGRSEPVLFGGEYLWLKWGFVGCWLIIGFAAFWWRPSA